MKRNETNFKLKNNGPAQHHVLPSRQGVLSRVAYALQSCSLSSLSSQECLVHPETSCRPVHVSFKCSIYMWIYNSQFIILNSNFEKSFVAFIAFIVFITLTIALAKSAGVLGWDAQVNRKRLCDNNEDTMIQDFTKRARKKPLKRKGSRSAPSGD